MVVSIADFGKGRKLMPYAVCNHRLLIGDFADDREVAFCTM
jgi:hypothetical protein